MIFDKSDIIDSSNSSDISDINKSCNTVTKIMTTNFVTKKTCVPKINRNNKEILEKKWETCGKQLEQYIIKEEHFCNKNKNLNCIVTKKI